MIEIKSTSPILAATLNRCLTNLSRIKTLVSSHEISQNSDVLRLCVVFLHATVEDCMRNLIYFHITSNLDAELLNQIPFKDHNNHGRPEKLALGELLKYKDSSIDSLILNSIEEYVNRLTFNNSSDIIKWLIKFKLDFENLKVLLPKIDLLFSRRHNIVHNSDFDTQRSDLNSTLVFTDFENHKLFMIDKEFINDGMATVSSLFMLLIAKFTTDHEISLKNLPR